MKTSAAIGEAGFAVLALALFLYLLIKPSIDDATVLKMIGLVAGVLLGFLSVCMSVLRARQRRGRMFRLLELLFSPLSGIVAVVISVDFGTGFILGSFASFALGHSLKTLIELPASSDSELRPGS